MKKIVLLIFLHGLLFQFAFSQSKSVSGYVYSEDGNPLPNVTVSVASSDIFAKTDSAGYWCMDLEKGLYLISYEHNNFQTKEIDVYVNNRKQLQLSDTLEIYRNVIIRCRSTVAEANPLYIVDGVIVGYEFNGDPSRIESITILKEPEEIVPYGKRGAAGVVLITTKTYAGAIDEYACIIFQNKGFIENEMRKQLVSAGITLEHEQALFCSISNTGKIQILYSSNSSQKFTYEANQILESSHILSPFYRNVHFEIPMIFSIE